ncbi:class F sortase (plasmid) [Amycolatopsis sp. AA4]|uniref:class F sortase n=1 Tax=Actinomycetes TaxID=1760 RepID=UPI0001B57686|nr:MULTISPECIES: class F sortase [Actinomycetes]ATY17234.1 class F sortase [Amycolatopsis sp. AA4]EFL12708.1 predicted protein [Streptomyces sp. AA4]
MAAEQHGGGAPSVPADDRGGRRPGRRTGLLLAAGAITVAAGIAIAVTAPSPGPAAAGDGAGSGRQAPPPVTVAPAPVPGPGEPEPVAPAPVPARADTGDAPNRLILPDGSAASVDTIAPTGRGALHPPTDPGRVGWWVDSALPGSGTGAVVVTGHINWAGHAGFARRWLPPSAGGRVEPGQDITLSTTGSGPRRYRVTGTRAYDKRSGLPSEVNRRTGPETLLLITCGGRWAGGDLGYADNLITTAQPA